MDPFSLQNIHANVHQWFPERNYRFFSILPLDLFEAVAVNFIHFGIKQPFATEKWMKTKKNIITHWKVSKLYASFKYVLAYNNAVTNWIAWIATNQCQVGQRIMNKIERKIDRWNVRSLTSNRPSTEYYQFYFGYDDDAISLNLTTSNGPIYWAHSNFMVKIISIFQWFLMRFRCFFSVRMQGKGKNIIFFRI